MTLGIYGASATGIDLYEMILEMGQNRWEEIIFIDDTKDRGEAYGLPMMPFDDFKDEYPADKAKLVLAIGEPAGREAVYKKVKNYGYSLETIIHPSCFVSPTTTLGEGCVVKMNTIISAHTNIDNNVYIQSGVIIGHDVVIKKNTMVSARSFIAGDCQIGEKVFIGIQSCIREKTVVGDNVIVAMAAAVMKDVPENSTVMGNPARVISANSHHKVFK